MQSRMTGNGSFGDRKCRYKLVSQIIKAPFGAFMVSILHSCLVDADPSDDFVRAPNVSKGEDTIELLVELATHCQDS